MESKDAVMYTIKTEDIIQTGKDIFPTYAHLFELSTPGSYMQFYDIDMGIKTKTVSVLSSFLEELNGLKSRINHELFLIVSRPDATVGETNTLMEPIYQLRDDLTLFEKKFSEYPLRTFVASVMEKGTPLDIIGLIEKFRYDRVFDSNASYKLPMYIDELIRMFKIKHGDALYQKI